MPTLEEDFELKFPRGTLTAQARLPLAQEAQLTRYDRIRAAEVAHNHAVENFYVEYNRYPNWDYVQAVITYTSATVVVEIFECEFEQEE